MTKSEAMRRLTTQGDVGAVVEFIKKRTLKRVERKFRGVYREIHPSEKLPNKLGGSVAHRAMKLMLRDR